MGIKSQDPNSTITGTGASQGAYVKTGALLNDAQLEFFRKQNLDIAQEKHGKKEKVNCK